MSIPFQCDICKGKGVINHTIDLGGGRGTNTVFCHCTRGDVVMKQLMLTTFMEGKDQGSFIQLKEPFDDYE
jgi:hypothetical protein